ncbi:thiol-disulfide oxidoreductase ResA [Rossellomorea aquimaris]|uniref:Thiol-disulfide oxidoreductase ResA n=1 Tax=Rossellomorea aquimaris TaxID=189382 RepID=A0A5D4TQK5_9BACI|nr:thiol-disulfide oxidoreductase ResA [Rossellomorea aquimaris]TYS76346.1 thiol-disulfide oxidoreductase ResA [Rossellomorea aquimaris]
MDKKKRRLLIRTIILVVLAAAVIYTLYANFTKEERGVLKAGDQAPDFVLQDMEGNTHQLSDYKGQGVFLNFWGTWCKPCEKEMPYMENQYQAFKDEGVQILAVNVGESDFQVNKFIEEHDLTFPVVVDSEIDVQNAYGIKPLPTTLLVDENGIIQRIITGEMTETDIEQHMKSIKPN